MRIAKLLILTVAIVTLTTGLEAGAWFGSDVIHGSGRATSEERKLPDFSKVRISHGLDAEITVGEKQSVVVWGDENLVGLVSTKVEGDQLIIEPAERNQRFKPDEGLMVRITLQELKAVSASGGSDLAIAGADGESLEIHASGGSDIDLTDLGVTRLQVHASGGSDVDARGEVDRVELHCSGGSDFSGSRLEARDVELQVSGGSDAWVNVSGSLSGSASGGSDVHYKGSPEKVDVSRSGSSDLHGS